MRKIIKSLYAKGAKRVRVNFHRQVKIYSHPNNLRDRYANIISECTEPCSTATNSTSGAGP